MGEPVHGSPTTSTSGTSAATRPGSGPPARGVRRRRPRGSRRPPAARPRRQRGGHAHAAGEPAVLVLGPVGRAPHPVAGHQHAEPGGPPQSPASAASRSHASPTSTWPRLAPASTQQRDAGRPRRGVHRPRPAGECRPRRWRAAGRPARRRAGDRVHERVRVHPAEPVHRDGTRFPAKSAAFSTAARSTAPTTTSAPARRRRARRTDGAVQRRRVARREVDLGRPRADGRRRSPRARRRGACARAALGVQAAGVRPALVERLEERRAGRREQRSPAAGVQHDPGAVVCVTRGRRGATCRRRAGCSRAHRNPGPVTRRATAGLSRATAVGR